MQDSNINAAAGEHPGVSDAVWEALQRLIENGSAMGPSSHEDAMLVARWRGQFLRRAADSGDSAGVPSDERAAFEREYPNCTTFRAMDPAVAAWEAWQARAALSSVAAPAVEGEPLAHYDPEGDRVVTATQMHSMLNHQGAPGRAAARTYTVPLAALPQAAAPGQPVFWYRPVGQDGGYEGPVHHSNIEPVRQNSGGWVPLYAAAPAATPHPSSQAGEPCPSCKQPADILYRVQREGDELDTVHCGCLYRAPAGGSAGHAAVEGPSDERINALWLECREEAMADPNGDPLRFRFARKLLAAAPTTGKAGTAAPAGGAELTIQECTVGNLLLDRLMWNRYATREWPRNWKEVRAKLVEAIRLADPDGAVISAYRDLREGWVMVPVEPTPEMLERGCLGLFESSLRDLEATHGEMQGAYRAMVSAAPGADRSQRKTPSEEDNHG